MAGATCYVLPGFLSCAGIDRGAIMAAAFAIVAPVILLTTMFQRDAGKGMNIEAVK